MNYDYSSFHYGEEPYIVSKSIPVENSRNLLSKQEQYESNNRSYPRSMPIGLRNALGSTLEDVDGNKFLDFFSGCGVVNLGHNNPVIMERMKRQMERVIHALDFPTEIKVAFMEKLNACLPESLRDKVKFNFCGPTGADAVEAGIKLARINTKREAVFSFHGAFHGMTAGALSVTCNDYNRKAMGNKSAPVHFFPYSYCYRCPFGKRPESCKLQCATFLRSALENPSSGVDIPAAIIIEPIQGEGGSIIPREGYLEEIVKIGNDYNIPVIFDEIQVGFYRTGKLFSFEHTAAVPDLITVSKGIGGIGMPLAILILRNELDKWTKATHTGTFRGNQLSIAAGAAALSFVKDTDVLENAAAVGKHMLQTLEDMKKRSKFIGEVRGRGLIFGVEYVKNLKTRVPFPELVKELREECLQKGLLFEVGGHYDNVIRFLPPLVTTKKMADNFLRIYDIAHQKLERKFQ